MNTLICLEFNDESKTGADQEDCTRKNIERQSAKNSGL